MAKYVIKQIWEWGDPRPWYVAHKRGLFFIQPLPIGKVFGVDDTGGVYCAQETPTKDRTVEGCKQKLSEYIEKRKILKKKDKVVENVEIHN